MAENYTATESFYGGAESPLSPDYGGFLGFRMGAEQLGFPGSPQTANQLGETVNALKQGVKAFEVSLLIPDTAEAVPKEHFKEMRALMKLSGVKPSMHGPLVDAAGWGEKGWNGDVGREDSERRMFDAIEKAHMLDPNGNVPIVFHGAAGVPGTESKPGKDGKPIIVKDEEDNDIEKRKFSLKAMRDFLWAGMLFGNAKITKREVGKLLEFGNFQYVVTEMMSAITGALPEKVDEEKN